MSGRKSKPKERKRLPLPEKSKVTFKVYRDTVNRPRVILAIIETPIGISAGMAICSTVDISKGLMKISRGKEIALGKAFKLLTKVTSFPSVPSIYRGRPYRSPFALKALEECGIFFTHPHFGCSFYSLSEDTPELSLDKPDSDLLNQEPVCEYVPLSEEPAVEKSC